MAPLTRGSALGRGGHWCDGWYWLRGVSRRCRALRLRSDELDGQDSRAVRARRQSLPRLYVPHKTTSITLRPRAGRDESKAVAAISSLERVLEGGSKGSGSLEFLPFDLTDLKSCQRAAQILIEKEKRLDIVGTSICHSLPYRGSSDLPGCSGQCWDHGLPLNSHRAFINSRLRTY